MFSVKIERDKDSPRRRGAIGVHAARTSLLVSHYHTILEYSILLRAVIPRVHQHDLNLWARAMTVRVCVEHVVSVHP